MPPRVGLVILTVFLAADATGGGGDDPHASARERMVDTQLAARGVADERVLAAMRTVPRHRFVPERLRHLAYDDNPLPIGHDQTISQPYIVALMTAAIRPQPTDTVLEIGTGSGYQAAVLAELVSAVYTIEIVTPLAERAREALHDLGHDNCHVRTGDGYRGWPEHAPFDKIIITAAPDEVPRPLLEQLAPGGLLVVPEGDERQTLTLYRRQLEDDARGRPRFERKPLLAVRFVRHPRQLRRRHAQRWVCTGSTTPA